MKNEPILRPVYLVIGVITGILFSGTNAFAVPTISGVQANEITKSSARIFWTTNEPTNTDGLHPDHILYGLSKTYGRTSAVLAGDHQTRHEWFIGGLAPDTTYHYCPQSTGTTGLSVCNGTANDFTFTTAPGTSVADLPQPPVTVDVSMPVQKGKTWTVASNCGDPQAGLQAVLNSSALGDTIVIPAGEVCTGVFNFPAKTGAGWVVVRTSTPDDKLPPPGNRITPSQTALLATIRSNGMFSQIYPTRQPGYPACDNWGSSDGYINFGWDFSSVYQCRSKSWKTVTPVARGATPPATCKTGDWFYQTPPYDGINYEMWCVAPNEWEHMTMDGNGTSPRSGGVYFMSNANHYHLVGLEITQLPTPSTEAAVGAATAYPNLVSSEANVDSIILDRCYIHGQAYPSQTGVAIQFSGSNVAVVDSYIDQINFWTPDHSINERESYGLLIDVGPGPGRIENNYIGVVGISFYITENGGVGVPTPADYVIRHNYFFSDDSFRFGSPTNAGENHHYFERHHFELKRGQRLDIEGNILQHSWAEVQQGDLMTFTPRPGSSATGTNLLEISDILIKDNIFRDAAEGLVIAGHTDNENTTPTQQAFPPSLQRMQLTNNAFYNIDGRLTCPQGRYGPSGRFGVGLVLEITPEDLTLTHNTLYKMAFPAGARAIKIANSTFPTPGANLVLQDNVLPANGGEIIQSDVSLEGLPALNAEWARGTQPGYIVDHNVFFNEDDLYSEPDKSSVYPPGNFWAATESSVGFGSVSDPSNLGITGASPYAGKASDGTNPGVNEQELTAATVHTVDGQWGGTGVMPVTPTPTIAPDSGSYNNSVSVTITDSDGGAIIHYTIDGSNPSANSTIYKGPFTLTTNATVKAIAIGPGMASSAQASTDFTVISQGNPVLSVTPVTFSFIGVQDGSTPPAQTLKIANTGTGTMSWSVKAESTWLTFSESNGTVGAKSSQSISLHVSLVGLSSGTYQDSVLMTGVGANGSPKNINVVLKVGAPGAALLTIAPPQLTFSVTDKSDALSQQSVTLLNAGGATTPWSAVSSANWLSISPMTGTLSPGQSALLTATVNTAGLDDGTYTQAIILLAPGASNNPQIMWATVTVGHGGATSPVVTGVGNLDPRLFPNPWRKDRNVGQSIHWDQLGAGTTVHVFTVSGHQITTVTADAAGRAVWDPSNAASGIYLYVATDAGGTKKAGKFAIVH